MVKQEALSSTDAVFILSHERSWRRHTGCHLQNVAIFAHKIRNLKSLMGIQYDFAGFGVGSSYHHEAIQSWTDAYQCRVIIIAKNVASAMF